MGGQGGQVLYPSEQPRENTAFLISFLLKLTFTPILPWLVQAVGPFPAHLLLTNTLINVHTRCIRLILLIAVGATNAADSVTSFFSSSKSEAEENGHCISNDGGCHIGPAAKRGDEVAAVMKTGAHSVVGYFADAFEGMKKKISTSASELFDSVRTAMRSVLYEELGKLFTPDLSTPG